MKYCYRTFTNATLLGALESNLSLVEEVYLIFIKILLAFSCNDLEKILVVGQLRARGRALISPVYTYVLLVGFLYLP